MRKPMAPIKEARIDAGLCRECGQRADGKYCCARCRKKDVERNLRNYMRKHPNARPGRRRCGICRRKGHTAPRCTRPEQG